MSEYDDKSSSSSGSSSGGAPAAALAAITTAAVTAPSAADATKTRAAGEDGCITVCVRARPLTRREAAHGSCLVFRNDVTVTVLCDDASTAATRDGSEAAAAATSSARVSDVSAATAGDEAALCASSRTVASAAATTTTTTQLTQQHSFTFDHVYGPDTSQERVYADIGRPVVQLSLRGYNTCIFAYGQTGSGKSYSMMGPHGGREVASAPGIVPRLCEELFAQLQQLRDEAAAAAASSSSSTHYDYHVTVSYAEIYRERVHCLLRPAAAHLRVRQHPVLGVYVEGLTEVPVQRVDEVLQVMVTGNEARHTAATRMNDTSSRSHAIFALQLVQRRTYSAVATATTATAAATAATAAAATPSTELRARVNLVDLAGSERVRSSGATGAALREGAHINQSLTTLGLVISALAEASKAGRRARHIPYRDSTLTFLLKESLGGNSRTFMLSTVSPARVYSDETLSTLRYADRAKAIVTRAFVNETAGDRRIRELEEEVRQLRQRIDALLHMQQQQQQQQHQMTSALHADDRHGSISTSTANTSHADAVESTSRHESSDDSAAATAGTSPCTCAGGCTPAMLRDVQALCATLRHTEQAMRYARTHEALLQQQHHDTGDNDKKASLSLSSPASSPSPSPSSPSSSSSSVLRVRNDAALPYLVNLSATDDWVVAYLTHDRTVLGTAPAQYADMTSAATCDNDDDGNGSATTTAATRSRRRRHGRVRSADAYGTVTVSTHPHDARDVGAVHCYLDKLPDHAGVLLCRCAPWRTFVNDVADDDGDDGDGSNDDQQQQTQQPHSADDKSKATCKMTLLRSGDVLSLGCRGPQYRLICPAQTTTTATAAAASSSSLLLPPCSPRLRIDRAGHHADTMRITSTSSSSSISSTTRRAATTTTTRTAAAVAPTAGNDECSDTSIARTMSSTSRVVDDDDGGDDSSSSSAAGAADVTSSLHNNTNIDNNDDTRSATACHDSSASNSAHVNSVNDVVVHAVAAAIDDADNKNTNVNRAGDDDGDRTRHTEAVVCAHATSHDATAAAVVTPPCIPRLDLQSLTATRVTAKAALSPQEQQQQQQCTQGGEDSPDDSDSDVSSSSLSHAPRPHSSSAQSPSHDCAAAAAAAAADEPPARVRRDEQDTTTAAVTSSCRTAALTRAVVTARVCGAVAEDDDDKSDDGDDDGGGMHLTSSRAHTARSRHRRHRRHATINDGSIIAQQHRHVDVNNSSNSNSNMLDAATTTPAAHVTTAYRSLNRYSFVFVGPPGAGKTSTRINLQTPDTWHAFFTHRTPQPAATCGIDRSVVDVAVPAPLKLTLLELGGAPQFALLHDQLPARRATYVLCFSLRAASAALEQLRHTLENVLCQADHADVHLLLLATHADQCALSCYPLHAVLREVEAQVSGFVQLLQPCDAQRPRMAGCVAVDNTRRRVYAPTLSGGPVRSFGDLLRWLSDHAYDCCRRDVVFAGGVVPARCMQLARRLTGLRLSGRLYVSMRDYKTFARLVDAAYGSHGNNNNNNNNSNSSNNEGDGSFGNLHAHTQLLTHWQLVQHAFRHTRLRHMVIVDVRGVQRLLASLACCAALVQTARDSDSAAAATVTTTTTTTRACGTGRDGSATHTRATHRSGSDDDSDDNEDDASNSSGSNTTTTTVAVAACMKPTRTMAGDGGSVALLDLQAVLHADVCGLLPHGVLTTRVLAAVTRACMRSTERVQPQLNRLLHLLLCYDHVVLGHTLRYSHADTPVTTTVTRPVRSCTDGTRSGDDDTDEDDEEDEEDTDDVALSPSPHSARWQSFVLLPCAFTATAPAAVVQHVCTLVTGPFYRFTFSLLPTQFFARLVSRLSQRACCAVYLGPARRRVVAADGAVFPLRCDAHVCGGDGSESSRDSDSDSCSSSSSSHRRSRNNNSDNNSSGKDAAVVRRRRRSRRDGGKVHTPQLIATVPQLGGCSYRDDYRRTRHADAATAAATTTAATTMAHDTAHVDGFWRDAVWLIGPGSSRALLRLVHHSLFVCFDDVCSGGGASDGEAFYADVLEDVRSVVRNSPGTWCTEAVLCTRDTISPRRNATDNDATTTATAAAAATTGSVHTFYHIVDDNLNSLGKLRAREARALATARTCRGAPRRVVGSSSGSSHDALRRGACSDDGDEEDVVPVLHDAHTQMDAAAFLQLLAAGDTLSFAARQAVTRAVCARNRVAAAAHPHATARGRAMDCLVDVLARL